jgi:hypothetical protein
MTVKDVQITSANGAQVHFDNGVGVTVQARVIVRVEPDVPGTVVDESLHPARSTLRQAASDKVEFIKSRSL